jgi:hypothetical protein
MSGSVCLCIPVVDSYFTFKPGDSVIIENLKITSPAGQSLMGKLCAMAA